MHIRIFFVPLLVVFTPKANISFGVFKVIPCFSQKGLGGMVGEPQHLAFKSYCKKTRLVCTSFLENTTSSQSRKRAQS